MADHDQHDDYDESSEPEPDVRQSFKGFIRSVPELGTTQKGHAKFYARVGQQRWRLEPDGSYTRLPNTYHDLVAYKGAAVRAYKKLQQNDHFIAHGRLEEYVSRRTGKTKKRFTAYALGHDMAYTRYEVDRTPRHDPAEHDTAAHSPAAAETPSREAAEPAATEERRTAAERETPAFAPPEHRPDRQHPAMGL